MYKIYYTLCDLSFEEYGFSAHIAKVADRVTRFNNIITVRKLPFTFDNLKKCFKQYVNLLEEEIKK